MRSLIVSDYDGTFSTSVKDIEINCDKIFDFMSRGNYFLLSSGRSYDSLMSKVKKYHIPYSYIGTCDGSYLFDKGRNMIDSFTMSPDILQELEPLFKRNIYEKIQYSYPKTYGNKYDKKSPLASVVFVIDNKKVDSSFLEEFDLLKENNKDYDFTVYTYGGTSYYIVRSKGTNKGRLVESLAEKINVSKDNIYTIGDNDNDFEMIRDYNGYMIGDNLGLISVALNRYNAVHELVSDINKGKVLKRKFESEKGDTRCL